MISSMLARLQIFTTLSLLLSAMAWGAGWWRYSTTTALVGAGVVLFGYSAVLAIELVAQRLVSRGDPTPPASVWALCQAWWAETWVTPQVFCWRQPFRAGAVPDQLTGEHLLGQRGVVFLHGYICNRGFWTPWLKRLQGTGHAFAAPSLEPVFASLDDYAAAVERAVQQVTQASGLPPILVCHSMGGLVARAWLASGANAERVHRVVTLGTPHQGAWWAHFGTAINARQMRPGGDWLRRSAAAGADHSRFICWYSDCDNMVFPPSTACLAGADNRLVMGAAHVQLAFLPEVMAQTLAELGELGELGD